MSREHHGDQQRPRAGVIDRAVSGLLVAMVRGYQWTLSPLLGAHCRFRPTCSEYFIGSVRRHGALRGTLRGCRRILRCHPLSRGGWDPP